jgi:hypothetical protein
MVGFAEAWDSVRFFLFVEETRRFRELAELRSLVLSLEKNIIPVTDMSNRRAFPQILREAEPRGLGLAPENKAIESNNTLLFQKRSKSVSFTKCNSRPIGAFSQILREAEPRGLGLAPEKRPPKGLTVLFFSRREAKALDGLGGVIACRPIRGLCLLASMEGEQS